MKLIAGLGNPGAEYAGTRHNVGFEVVEVLARRHGIAVTKRNFQAVFGEGQIDGERILLVRPMTFMNLSGESVGAMCRFYKIETADVIVIVDDVALPVGKIRLRYKGSSGGQNGLDNVIKHLHTQEVPRIRLGVGAAGASNLRGHVLSRFRPEELPLIREAYERTADAVECAIREGFDIAMNRFNISEKPEKPPKPPKPDGVEPEVPRPSGESV